MAKTWKTPKGTELPLLTLQKKDYLQVAHRIVWMREEKPSWSILTEIIDSSATHCTMKASILDENGRIIAQSHKHEDKQGFPDFREKSETGAVGRALALCGYGTQFCGDELDEKERLADSPLPPNHSSSGPLTQSGGKGFGFGKYGSTPFKDIPIEEIKNYMSYMVKMNEGKKMSPNVEAGLSDAKAFLLAGGDLK